jgi:hypothetical protein
VFLSLGRGRGRKRDERGLLVARVTGRGGLFFLFIVHFFEPVRFGLG